MDDLNQPGVEILPYPLQRALVRNLSDPAEKAKRPDLLPMWAGQSASLSRETDVNRFLQALVDEIESAGDAMVQWTTSRKLRRSAATTSSD